MEAHDLVSQALLAEGFQAAAIPHLEKAQRIDLSEGAAECAATRYSFGGPEET
jgi:hypothetical protein